jgi:glyoxylase-like metal-dependent hydrolase (beta-lactamase superfamily II)
MIDRVAPAFLGIALLMCCTVSAQEPAAPSRVPKWNARGLGPLPWQGIACVDMTADGKYIAIGTIAPPGDPNVFLLDGDGKLLEQHSVGQRWINEIVVGDGGAFMAALCTSPTGAAGDPPAIFTFVKGRPTPPQGETVSPLLFHYGDHSNHLARTLATDGKRLICNLGDSIRWTTPGEDAKGSTVRVATGDHTVISMAASASGRVVVGTVVSQLDKRSGSRNVMVLEPGKAKPIWERAVYDIVDAAPEPAMPRYGPPAPQVRDFKAWAPLQVAIDRAGKQIAVADYEGWERVLLPPGDRPFTAKQGKLGFRFMPARPTVSVYDADGKRIRLFSSHNFKEPFWCDLAFAADGANVLVSPHNWTSRGLAGQPFLPADEGARNAYLLKPGSGHIITVPCGDAISDAVGAVGDDLIVLSSWDGRLYLRDGLARLMMDKHEARGPTRVRVSSDATRILVATALGSVRMMDDQGRALWRSDLNKLATPGAKPWTKNQQAGKFAPGLWHVNSGRTPSDLGNQYVIEAPDGLILIDPNAGLSIEQNWARIKSAGLDPMKVKYVLATHEHGDHAPGAYLWRVITGAQFVCSPEMAYTLQHDIPLTSGYGFHPPVPTDITIKEDTDLDLAEFKIRALRLPGHTYGSMGWTFEIGGKRYVSTGDLIMPGGVLGYAGSLNFKAADILASLRKLDTLKPDVVLGGHGLGDPDKFIKAGIAAAVSTGWGKMKPEHPDPLYRFTQQNYLVAGWLENIATAAVGDVDGDGLPDVAVLTEGAKGLSLKVYLNKKGTFAATPDCVVAVPDLPSGFHLRMAQINDDGIADFLVSSDPGAALLISQKGKLDYRVVPLPAIVRAASLATGDFNGDGRTDCLIGQRFVNGYTLAYQDADGNFKTATGKGVTRSYLDMQLVDVNNDGRADLITAAGEVFLRRPNGTLPDGASLTLKHPFGTWTFLGVGDFNADGRPDVVLLGKDEKRARAAVFYNSGDARAPFAAEPSVVFELGFDNLLRDGPTVGDWNGDGIADLVVSNEQGKEAVIFLGSKGDGLSPKNTSRVTLDYRIHYDTRLAIGDFTGSGRLDLAGFGHSETGAPGVYIWLHPPRNGKK